MPLRRPRLPKLKYCMMVRRLRVGGGRVDLMIRRHDSSVAVNLLQQDGPAEVEVIL
jgi:hypothetical protein